MLKQPITGFGFLTKSIAGTWNLGGRADPRTKLFCVGLEGLWRGHLVPDPARGGRTSAPEPLNHSPPTTHSLGPSSRPPRYKILCLFLLPQSILSPQSLSLFSARSSTLTFSMGQVWGGVGGRADNMTKTYSLWGL